MENTYIKRKFFKNISQFVKNQTKNKLEKLIKNEKKNLGKKHGCFTIKLSKFKRITQPSSCLSKELKTAQLQNSKTLKKNVQNMVNIFTEFQRVIAQNNSISNKAKLKAPMVQQKTYDNETPNLFL